MHKVQCKLSLLSDVLLYACDHPLTLVYKLHCCVSPLTSNIIIYT